MATMKYLPVQLQEFLFRPLLQGKSYNYLIHTSVSLSMYASCHYFGQFSIVGHLINIGNQLHA